MKRWLGVAMVLGCGCALHHSEPFMGPLVLNDKASAGQRIYMVQCQQCHPGGEGGLGPSLSDKPTPREAKRLQIRAGLGAMPAFDEAKISSDDLDALIDYMDARRAHKKS